MASKKEYWTKADVRCPFYITDDRSACTISCEGYSDHANVTSRFGSLAEREKHMGSYCAGRYERCPMYQCTYGAKYDD